MIELVQAIIIGLNIIILILLIILNGLFWMYTDVNKSYQELIMDRIKECKEDLKKK